MRQHPSAITRLGKHHFLHLKAVAMGVGIQEAALCYLSIHHGHQSAIAHRLTVEAVRALARRQGEAAWRLIGLMIRVDLEQPQAPTIAEFAASRGLEDWSEEDLRQFYLEAYPIQAELAGSNKAKRRERLRSAQLELLERLEKVSVQPPSAVDPVATWFDPVTSQKLINAGMVTLLDLAERIAVGGRWFGAMPGVGVKKAQRIEAFVRNLLGDQIPAKRTFDLSATNPAATLPAGNEPAALVAAQNRLPIQLTYDADVGILTAQNDAEAIAEWVEVKAGSAQTARAYRREATRLLLWLREANGGKVFADMTAGDCKRYMAFLKAIPTHWQSRTRAQPGAVGWAPFRGAELNHKSRQYAINVLASFFTWLQAAQYIPANPWVLVNRKLGDDPEARKLDTKALSEGAMAEILRVIGAQPPLPFARPHSVHPGVRGGRGAASAGAALGTAQRFQPGARRLGDTGPRQGRQEPCGSGSESSVRRFAGIPARTRHWCHRNRARRLPLARECHRCNAAGWIPGAVRARQRLVQKGSGGFSAARARATKTGGRIHALAAPYFRHPGGG